MKTVKYLIAGIIVLFVYSCNKENAVEPVLSELKIEKVQIIEGGAIVTWYFPIGQGIIGAKIVYEPASEVITRTVLKEEGMSLELTGFTERKEYEFTAYAVYPHDKLSPKGVSAKFRPQFTLPTVSNVQSEPIMGGAIIRFTPPSHSDFKGVKALYTLTAGGEAIEKILPKGTASVTLEGFTDADEHSVVLTAIYTGETAGQDDYSRGVEEKFRPLSYISNIVVENGAGKVKISYTLDPVIAEIKAIYRLTDDGVDQEIVLPKTENSILLDGFVDDKQRIVRLIAELGGKVVADIKVTIKPLPHISNIVVENVSLGAFISYTLSSDVKLIGIKVVYTPTDGGTEMVIDVPKSEKKVELRGFADTKDREVVIYVVYEDRTSPPFKVAVKPKPPVLDPVKAASATGIVGGVDISWTLPTADGVSGVKIVYSYGNGGRLIEKFVSIPATSTQIDGFYKANAQKALVYAAYDLFGSRYYTEEPVEVAFTTIARPDANAIVELPNVVNNEFFWKLFDAGSNNPADAESRKRFEYRGEIHTPSNRQGKKFESTRYWHAATTNNDNEIWMPGGDAANDMTLTTFTTGSAGDATKDPTPYPLYVSFDLGRKAVYSKMAYVIRTRGNSAFSASSPVEFVIWGCNNPKLIENVGDGSREANLKYWTGWAAVGGTDAWKNDWTKLATCQYANEGAIPLTGNDLLRYQGKLPPFFADSQLPNGTNVGQFGLGYDFTFNQGVTEAFRYIRWEIIRLSNEVNPGQRGMQLKGIKYWGTFAD